MFNEIMSLCDKRYKNGTDYSECKNCNFGEFCPKDCEKCLEFVHYPDHIPVGAPQRRYDCSRMADFYLCKYGCRYFSEMYYAFQRLKNLKQIKYLKVLSMGCGPCTDLLALDYLRQTGIYHFQTLDFYGIDYSQDVWKNIHDDIKKQCTAGINTEFLYENVFNIINSFSKNSWIPNLVTFQYVFSDMQKNSITNEIDCFIKTLSKYINSKMESGSYIVLNDINLSIKYNGGREYFARLFNFLEGCSNRYGQFHNNNPRRHTYNYGEGSDGEFPSNELIIDESQWAHFNPYDSCSSAQMIIKKE